MKYLIAGVAYLACVSVPIASAETARNLEDLGGVIEQTRFTISDSLVIVERNAWNSKTGETQHIKFRPVPILTQPPVLDPHALPAEVENGFLGMEGWDVYWDVPQQRWRKIPKGFADCVGPSLDRN